AVPACATEVPRRAVTPTHRYSCRLEPGWNPSAKPERQAPERAAASGLVRPQGEPSAIQIDGVSKAFRIGGGLFQPARSLLAVDHVPLPVPAGGVLGIVGESGCGKSTLARLMLGLLAPSAGEVLIEGRTLAQMDRRERARIIQPVFQDPFGSMNPRRPAR